MFGRQPRFLLMTRGLLLLCVVCVLVNLKLHSILFSSPNGLTSFPPPILEDIWNQEQHSILSTSNGSDKWRQDIVIGIPTVARKGNPDYLIQSINSLLLIGHLDQSQLFLLHGKPDEKHDAFNFVQESYPNLHIVRQDTDSEAMSPNYIVTKSSSERAVHAFAEDDLDRKRWRISEAHDFIWLCRHMLDNTNATYIGFHQDDARLIDPFPDHLSSRLDGSTNSRHIVSLYSDHTPRENRRFCSTGGLFCGMVSLIFRRQVLEDFVSWIEPLYKEVPIDWNLEDFLVRRNYLIPVHASVQHLGSISSMNGKTSVLDQAIMTTRQFPNQWFNNHRVAFADRIVHNCAYEQDTHYYNQTVTPLVSWGIVYTIPSNQLMQHVVYHFRNKCCLRLAQLHVLPIPPKYEDPFQKQWIVENLLQNLNGRYDGYEPFEVQAIPLLDKVGDDNLLDSRIDQFLHVATYLLNKTSSPVLGFGYDDMLPFLRLDWEELQLNASQGMLSLYYEGGSDDNIPDPLCGSTVRCGFESMLFARSTIKKFVDWLSLQSRGIALEQQVLLFAHQEQTSIRAMNATRLIGKSVLERMV